MKRRNTKKNRLSRKKGVIEKKGGVEKKGGSLTRKKSPSSYKKYDFTEEEFIELVEKYNEFKPINRDMTKTKKEKPLIWTWLHEYSRIEKQDLEIGKTINPTDSPKYSVLTYFIAFAPNMPVSDFDKLLNYFGISDLEKYRDGNGHSLLIAACLAKNLVLLDHLLKETKNPHTINHKDHDGESIISILVEYINYEYEAPENPRQQVSQSQMYRELVSVLETILLEYDGDFSHLSNNTAINIPPDIQRLIDIDQFWKPLLKYYLKSSNKREKTDSAKSLEKDISNGQIMGLLVKTRKIVQGLLSNENACKKIVKEFPNFKSSDPIYNNQYCALMFAISVISSFIYRNSSLMIKGGKAIQLNLNKEYASDDIDIIMIPSDGKCADKSQNPRDKLKRMEDLKIDAYQVSQMLLFLMNDSLKEPEYYVLEVPSSHIYKFSHYIKKQSRYIAMSDISYGYCNMDPFLRELSYMTLSLKRNVSDKPANYNMADFEIDGIYGKIKYQTLEKAIYERLYFILLYHELTNIHKNQMSDLDKANLRFLQKAYHQIKSILDLKIVELNYTQIHVYMQYLLIMYGYTNLDAYNGATRLLLPVLSTK